MSICKLLMIFYSVFKKYRIENSFIQMFGVLFLVNCKLYSAFV